MNMSLSLRVSHSGHILHRSLFQNKKISWRQNVVKLDRFATSSKTKMVKTTSYMFRKRCKRFSCKLGLGCTHWESGDDADKSEDESEEGGMCKVEERRHVRTLEEQWPRVQRSEASTDRTGSGPRLVWGRHWTRNHGEFYLRKRNWKTKYTLDESELLSGFIHWSVFCLVYQIIDKIQATLTPRVYVGLIFRKLDIKEQLQLSNFELKSWSHSKCNVI